MWYCFPLGTGAGAFAPPFACGFAAMNIT